MPDPLYHMYLMGQHQLRAQEALFGTVGSLGQMAGGVLPGLGSLAIAAGVRGESDSLETHLRRLQELLEDSMGGRRTEKPPSHRESK